MSYAVEKHFEVIHGDSCAALLPAVARFNAVADIGKFREIAMLLGKNVDGLPPGEAALLAAEAIGELARDVGMPTLRQMGVSEKDLGKLAEEAIAVTRLMGNNPRAPSLEDVRGMFEDALLPDRRDP